MRDLLFPIGDNDNLGGIRHRSFFFVPVESIATQIGAVVTLKPGAVWYSGRAIKYSLKFTEDQADKQGGKSLYKPKLTGSIARWTPELEQALEEMDGRHFVVVFTDQNGYQRIAGTVEEYLTFQYDYETGDTPDKRNGISFTFEGKTRQAAPVFNQTLEPGPLPDPDPVGDPVAIQINGITVGFAQPGGTVNITSEYTFEYQILAP